MIGFNEKGFSTFHDRNKSEIFFFISVELKSPTMAIEDFVGLK
jgi:hypothetical protein